MDEGGDLVEDGEILEPCDVSSTPNQFSLSRATREPVTICSEESSNEKSEDSDDDSDAQCSKPKKPKPHHQLPVSRNEVPNKYKIWSIALQEQALMENLTKCDVEAMDRERSVESYNYKLVDKTDYSENMPEPHYNNDHHSDSDYEKFEERQFAPGSKRRHGDIKKRLGHRKHYIRARRLPELDVTAENSFDEVAKDIAHKLQEPKRDLIRNVVLVLGKEKAIELYNETKGIEDNGGWLLMNGERRRTSGGVYFLLIKRDNTINSDAMKEVFSDDVAQYNRKRRKIMKIRNKKKFELFKETVIREKLLNLNTEAFPEMKQSDAPSEGSNNQEEGEIELNVTNPPPSPASPPSPSHNSEEEGNIHCHPPQPDNLGRSAVAYEEPSDDDYLEVDVDDMDVF